MVTAPMGPDWALFDEPYAVRLDSGDEKHPTFVMPQLLQWDGKRMFNLVVMPTAPGLTAVGTPMTTEEASRVAHAILRMLKDNGE